MSGDEIRSDVVRALSDGILEPDHERYLEGMLAAPTEAERVAAVDVVVGAVPAIAERENRRLDMLDLMIANGLRADRTWTEAWAALPEQVRQQIAADYYDVMFPGLIEVVDAWRADR